MTKVLYKVAKSMGETGLILEGQGACQPGLTWWRHMARHVCTFTEVEEQGDVEKRVAGNGESCAVVTGKRRHTDKDPKPCRQNSLWSTAKQTAPVGHQH